MKPISRRMKQVNREKDGKPVDTSQLRQPIRLGGSPLNQILNAVHYGSPEMRALLQVECNFIFECKVCRSLFRDFPNFISHKRVFCEKSALDDQWINLAQLSEEEVVMVEPEAPAETADQGPEDPASVSATMQDQPTDENAEEAHPVAASSQEQTELHHLNVGDRAVVQTKPHCETSTNFSATDQASPNLAFGSVDQPISQEEEQEGNQQEHKDTEIRKKGSGPRQSLEDTVQRLQARSTGQSYSLRVYAKAVEKVEKQKENARVTTIKTTAIPTNSNAVFVDFSTRTRQRGEKDPFGEAEVERISNTPKEDNLQQNESLHKRSEENQRQSRRKGSLSSRKDTGEAMQKDSKNNTERKQSKRKEGEPRTSKREEKQRPSQKKEQTPQSEPRQLRTISQCEKKMEVRKFEDMSDNFSSSSGSSLRSRFTQNVPKELIRVGKPRTVYPEPQQILMDQLREMQDKVKQKAAAQGKADIVELSGDDDDDEDNDGDSATDELQEMDALSPTKSDPITTASPTSKRSPIQKNGVYKCRMCTYEAVDKADCIRHIMRKHRYAMRHKSALAIRSMAVYQSSSKKQSKANSSVEEDKSATSYSEAAPLEGNRLHDIVRKNLQFALQKAEEVLQSRQNTSPNEASNPREGHKKQDDCESHPLMCKKCNKVYSCKASLNFHNSVTHSGTRTYYPCSKCKKVFATLQGLVRHLRSFHNISAEKVDRMREKLKKKAFSKRISQSQNQSTSDKSSKVRQPVPKRSVEDGEDRVQGPAKRQKLESSGVGKIDKETKKNADQESDLNALTLKKSSIPNGQEPDTKRGIQTMQSPSQVPDIKAEKKSSSDNLSIAKQSVRSNPEKDDPVSRQYSTSESSPYGKHRQSPRSSTPRDLSPRPTSYVCRKCKHHFGRKISFDNHVQICRGRRLITPSPKSDRKTTVLSAAMKPAGPVVARTSAAKEGREAANRDQSSPKTPSMPNSIGTRSKHRDSSSESQRSASSDSQTAVRTRVRVTRSLSPERNTKKETALSEAKNLSREKQVRRQIASFGNLYDGMRGRARRTVFSKYAKTTPTSDRPERTKLQKDELVQGSVDASTLKIKNSSKEAVPVPPNPSLSSSVATAKQAHEQQDAKAALKVNTLTSKASSIQTRHAKSTLKSDSDSGSTVSSGPDIPVICDSSSMDAERRMLVSSTHIDHIRDSDLSSTCSAEYSDSDSKDVAVSLRVRRSQQNSTKYTTKQACERATPERQLQQKSILISKQTGQRATPEKQSQQKSAILTPKQASERATPEKQSQQKSAILAPKQASERATPEKQSQQNSPIKTSKQTGERATPEKQSPQKSLIQTSKQTGERATPEKPSQQKSAVLTPKQTDETAMSKSTAQAERIVDDHSATSITGEGTRKKPWKAPDSNAIGRLVDVIKNASLKKTTIRGRLLDDTGLELSCAKPDTSLSNEEYRPENAESTEPCSTRGSQSEILNGKVHGKPDTVLPSLLSKDTPSSEHKLQPSSVSDTNNISSKALEIIHIKEESSKEVDITDSSNLATNSLPSDLNCKTDVYNQPCKPCKEEPSAPHQTIRFSEEKKVSYPQDIVSVEERSHSPINAELSGVKVSEKLHTDSDKDKLETCVGGDISMDCSDASSLNETKDSTPKNTTTVEHELDMAINCSQSRNDEQQPLTSNSEDTALSKPRPSTEKQSLSEKSLSTSKTKKVKVSVQQDNRITNIDLNNILGDHSTPGLRSRFKSSNYLKELKSQSEKKLESKPDLRGRIASRRIKEKHRALASRLSKVSAVNRKDAKSLNKSDNIPSPQAQSSPKKSVQIVDTAEFSEECITYHSELENIQGVDAGKSGKKKDKEGSRIKSSANRAYVMRSSAGERKLECFDKAKIFKYVDVAKTKCLACGVKYTKMYNLRRHIISNHLKWTRYRCSLCGCEKYDKAHILRHIKMVHRQVLKELSVGPVKSLIINLTKQGSQARSVKISHSIKRNQETERKHSESIYARPTLSLRRRGRPTLPLLSSSPPQNIPDDVSEHSKKKSAQEAKKDSSPKRNAPLSEESISQPCSLTMQPEASPPQSSPTVKNPASEVNGETLKDKVAVPKSLSTKVATARVRHPYSISGSEDPDESMPGNQNRKQSEENDNIFAQLQDVIVSSPSCSDSGSSNLSRRGLTRTQKVLCSPLSEPQSKISHSVSGARNVPCADKLSYSEHSPIHLAPSDDEAPHSPTGNIVNASSGAVHQGIQSSNHATKPLNPTVVLSSQLTEIIALAQPVEEQVPSTSSSRLLASKEMACKESSQQGDGAQSSLSSRP